MNRIWNVRLNLDAAAASLDSFTTDAEQGQWFRGYRMAARGVDLPQGATTAMVAGWREGRQAFEQATARQAQQADLANRRWGNAKASATAHAKASAPAPAVAPAKVDASAHAGAMPIEESRNRGIEESRISTSSSTPEPGLFDPDPVASKPAPTVMPPLNVADLQNSHPALLVTRDDRERMSGVLRLYGWDACSAGIAAVAKANAKNEPNRRRVLVGMLSDWLHQNYVLDPDDYIRAGLPVPKETA
jgi:hypothetical protein